MTEVQCLPTLDALLSHVHHALCGKDHLDPDQTPMAHTPILRQGRPCGLFIHVEGPRLLKNYAIWAGDENRILLYNASGERFGEIRLSEAPDPRELIAPPNGHDRGAATKSRRPVQPCR